MRIDRLHRVQEVLRNLTPKERKQFNMLHWMQVSPCRTVACALGWYIVKTPDCGLDLIPHRSLENTFIPIAPGDEALCHMTVLTEHFDLPDIDVKRIFYPGWYGELVADITPEMVIDRIEEVICAATPLPKKANG